MRLERRDGVRRGRPIVLRPGLLPECFRVAALLCLAGCVFGVAILSSGCRPKPIAYVPTAEQREWERYHAAEKSERFEEAESGYRKMCRAKKTHVRACFDLARLMFELGREGLGRELFLDFVRRYPDSGLAPVAVKKLQLNYQRAEDLEAGIDALASLAMDVNKTEAHDSVLFRLAALYRSAGRAQDEIRVLQQIITVYDRWESQLWDDAIWRLIAFHRERGDTRSEKRLIISLLETRESSWIVGSYSSPYHDDALLRLSRIELENKDYEKAEEYFQELADLESSRLRDEAYLGMARLWIARKDPKKACHWLKAIVEQMPAASSRREAIKVSRQLNCPD